jgi:gamma-glutamylcyclotransferase (GGCT)/AIG2-like uncharacterized protein YtfP
VFLHRTKRKPFLGLASVCDNIGSELTKQHDMHYLFSYGTLQQESVQRETFGEKLAGEKDTLTGYVVEHIRIFDAKVIKASGTDIHPILQYTGKDQDRVVGMVFVINDSQLAQADSYEVKDYLRKKAKLCSGKEAWIYTS